jgi:hypothetical protein
VIDSSSAKTVMASSKLTRCFRLFASAFWASHSNFTRAVYLGGLQAANGWRSAAPTAREEYRTRDARSAVGVGCTAELGATGLALCVRSHFTDR